MRNVNRTSPVAEEGTRQAISDRLIDAIEAASKSVEASSSNTIRPTRPLLAANSKTISPLKPEGTYNCSKYWVRAIAADCSNPVTRTTCTRGLLVTDAGENRVSSSASIADSMKLISHSSGGVEETGGGETEDADWF